MIFFVVGTSRSGSTLVRHMLAEHPEVAIVNESLWLPRMHEFFGTAPTDLDDLLAVVDKTTWDTGRRVIDVNLELSGTPADELTRRLRERFGRTATTTALHEAIIAELFAGDSESPLLGDKTPDYGFYMRLLQQLWPAARFVHVVRNGLDTARSMSRHSACQLMVSAGYHNWCPIAYDRLYERYRRRRLPLSAYVDSWHRRIERIRHEAEGLTPGTYLEIRYEAVIADTRDTLSRTLDFLGREAEGGWLDRAAELPRRPTTTGASADRHLGEQARRLVQTGLSGLGDRRAARRWGRDLPGDRRR